MFYESKEELLKDLEGAVKLNGRLEILNKELLKEKTEILAYNLIFNQNDSIRKYLYWLVWQIAQNLQIFPSSINSLYRAIGRGECEKVFTVPAINLRTLTFYLAQRIFRVAKRLGAGAFIFEIAKSEIGYTKQRPSEYTSLILLAAIKEDFKGCVFIQADHFQVKSNKEEEIDSLKDLIKEAINAGFFNIDIDTSTLVDLSKQDLDAQQKENYSLCAALTHFIRRLEPENITISVGGEIGEIGGKNSTPGELRAFMKGYLKLTEGIEGISKIAIQTGTTHGGVVLPDGSIARVKLDFDTLKNLSQIAKSEFKLAGCVQHGASTLPKEAFCKFPETGCCEIHLATQFQNIVYENMPKDLKEEIYSWLKENFKKNWKEGMTEEQFLYKTRKQALGAFKKKIYELPKEVLNKTCDEIEELFEFLFKQLKVEDTKYLVEKYVKPVPIEKKITDFLEEKELKNLEGAD